jgi:hypothetical protein
VRRVVLSGFGDEIFHSERTYFMSGIAGKWMYADCDYYE